MLIWWGYEDPFHRSSRHCCSPQGATSLFELHCAWRVASLLEAPSSLRSFTSFLVSTIKFHLWSYGGILARALFVAELREGFLTVKVLMKVHVPFHFSLFLDTFSLLVAYHVLNPRQVALFDSLGGKPFKGGELGSLKIFPLKTNCL